MLMVSAGLASLPTDPYEAAMLGWSDEGTDFEKNYAAIAESHDSHGHTVAAD